MKWEYDLAENVVGATQHLQALVGEHDAVFLLLFTQQAR